MKKIYSAADTIQAGHIHSVLENEGVDCWIKNQSLSGGIGELPPTECWPEVWLRNDEDYDRALKIISPIILPSETDQSPWQCRCGERLEGQFNECWQCGEQRPA